MIKFLINLYLIKIEFLFLFIKRSAKKRQEEEARTKRTNRMLIAMVVIFGTCWFPINLINLLADCMDLGKDIPSLLIKSYLKEQQLPKTSLPVLKDCSYKLIVSFYKIQKIILNL